MLIIQIRSGGSFDLIFNADVIAIGHQRRGFDSEWYEIEVKE